MWETERSHGRALSRHKSLIIQPSWERDEPHVDTSYNECVVLRYEPVSKKNILWPSSLTKAETVLL